VLGLLCGCAATLAAPAGAAADTYEVRGAGWGHGVGMSQYGAYGLAQHGRDYREILRRYYTGADVGAADSRKVRVLLQASRIPGTSFSAADRIGDEPLNPDRRYSVRPSGSSAVTVRRDDDKVVGRFPAPVAAAPAGSAIRLYKTALNGVEDGRYRGRMEFRPGASGGITSINVVGLDMYLLGVVPEEMPSSWHRQALRSQAVAARSYALASEPISPVFDFYPDTRSQVYRGRDAEEPRATDAVKDTEDRVVRYRGGVATTYFFSSSGGRTESFEHAFGGEPIPYLRSVDDPYDDISPRHRWNLTFSESEMEARLDELVRGDLRRIEVLERGDSPRIVRARIHGSQGDTNVSGATLRSRLDLFSTWARFDRSG
jgi:stage II sporulation protein D